jgi:hypothetical protein
VYDVQLAADETERRVLADGHEPAEHFPPESQQPMPVFRPDFIAGRKRLAPMPVKVPLTVYRPHSVRTPD